MGTPQPTTEELAALLESLDELPLEGGQRKSVIDWDSLRTSLTDDRGWFQIGTVCAELEKDLAERGITKPDGKPKKVHYSQVHGFVMRTAKKGAVGVRKKAIDEGAYPQDSCVQVT